ncbi:bestrophin family protein [Skermanella pratensis]|uniref:bestrophin family protein n=1 Tax=Skermanella pratensis TaxID=2233999 RepID=UPI0013014354|nr:bestrophin family ion channel [Skermanella pratensis]
MIVRNRPSAFQLFFIMKGSIVPRIKWQVLSTVAVAFLVTLAHGTLFDHKVTLTPIPFSLIGLALAIFLGFRNTATYDRWWEGRKLWGELLIGARSATRLVVSHARPAAQDAERPRIMVRRLIAFAYALKHHLRGTWDDQSRRYLSEADARTMAASANGPDHLLHLLSRDAAALGAGGRLDPMLLAQLEQNLTVLAGVQAGCERIRHTPLPFSYSLLLHRTAYLYCFALPFGLQDTTGFMTPFVVGLVSYTFFGLDAIGDEIEEPFGLLPNNLPLEAMCRRMEIDLLAALGETDLPPPLQPVDYSLA